MDENNRNFILAIVLSMVVLFAWQFFFVPEKPKEPEQQTQEQQQTEQGTTTPSAKSETPQATPQVGGGQPSQAAPAQLTRAEALAASPRVKIDTPAIRGSIALKGARLVHSEAGRHEYVFDGAQVKVAALLAQASAQVQVLDVETRRAPIDDIIADVYERWQGRAQ